MTKFVLTISGGRPSLPVDYPTLGFIATANGAILDGSLSTPAITIPPDAYWSVYGGGSAETAITRYANPMTPPVPESPNGFMLAYSNDQNTYLPTSPASLIQTAAWDTALANAISNQAVAPKHKITGSSIPSAPAPYFQAKDAGVDPANTAAANTSALQALITYVYGLGGGTVIMPTGVVQVNAEITVPEHIWIVGEAPGGWENYGTENAGCTIKLANSSALTVSQGVIRFYYAGTHTTERRHQGGMVGVAIDGNRTTNTANSGIVLAGVRFIHFERVHVFRCGLHGFSSVTDTTAVSEMSFLACFSGFNGGNGYRLFGGDSTLTSLISGVNDSDGFYLGLAATVCTGLSSWNNKRDGLAIASTAATEFLSIVGGEFYDNDRAGITVEAPGANVMYGNSIVGASCHGNGHDATTYTSATDRVGIRVVGAHTPSMLAIHGVSTGNRDTDTWQQYGVALQTANCNPTVSGVSGTNVTALWYLVDTTAIPESQGGRFVPLKDNVFSIGRSSLRWANFLGLRHTVFKTLNDAQPSAQLGTTAGAAELSFGPGGSTAPDWIMSRTAADTVTVSTGDSFAVEGVWNGGTLRIGTWLLWDDGTNLRAKRGTPASATDGIIIA